MKRNILIRMLTSSAYGYIGSALLLPSLVSAGLYAMSFPLDSMVKVPTIIALSVLGMLGIALARYKPYRIFGRIFLTVALIGGIVAGVIYLVYLAAIPIMAFLLVSLRKPEKKDTLVFICRANVRY